MPNEEIMKLEAQCAAMRALLNSLSVILIAYSRSPTMNSKPLDCTRLIEKIREALSPDAGQKVLDVVRAAKAFVDNGLSSIDGDRLVKTLSALGWKP